MLFNIPSNRPLKFLLGTNGVVVVMPDEGEGAPPNGAIPLYREGGPHDGALLAYLSLSVESTGDLVVTQSINVGPPGLAGTTWRFCASTGDSWWLDQADTD